MSELKKIREMTGMSQGAIGNWLNMSRSMICMIEKGERKLRFSLLSNVS